MLTAQGAALVICLSISVIRDTIEGAAWGIGPVGFTFTPQVGLASVLIVIGLFPWLKGYSKHDLAFLASPVGFAMPLTILWTCLNVYLMVWYYTEWPH